MWENREFDLTDLKGERLFFHDSLHLVFSLHLFLLFLFPIAFHLFYSSFLLLISWLLHSKGALSLSLSNRTLTKNNQ